MSFNHSILITHGISQDENDPSKVIMFNLEQAKAQMKDDGAMPTVDVIDIVDLNNVHKEAHNLLLASVLMYQSHVRIAYGIQHILKEIDVQMISKTIGPIFAIELASWLVQLQKITRIARSTALEGQAAMAERTKLLQEAANAPRIAPKE